MGYRVRGTTVPHFVAMDSGRARRVIVLTIAIAVMSIADLLITLTYLRNGGMGEANPLARWVLNFGSANILIVWKILTVVTACTIFVATRRSRAAEIGAWCCCLVLTWLSVRWMAYSHDAAYVSGAVAELEPSKWVSLDP
jgi:hypothetical protein